MVVVCGAVRFLGRSKFSVGIYIYSHCYNNNKLYLPEVENKTNTK